MIYYRRMLSSLWIRKRCRTFFFARTYLSVSPFYCLDRYTYSWCVTALYCIIHVYFVATHLWHLLVVTFGANLKCKHSYRRGKAWRTRAFSFSRWVTSFLTVHWKQNVVSVFLSRNCKKRSYRERLSVKFIRIVVESIPIFSTFCIEILSNSCQSKYFINTPEKDVIDIIKEFYNRFHDVLQVNTKYCQDT